MTEQVNEHNQQLLSLIDEININGSRNKLIFELYLVSVEDATEKGLEGKKLQKANEMANACAWFLDTFDRMQGKLTEQANLTKQKDGIIKTLMK